MRRAIILAALVLALAVTCLTSLFLGSRPNGISDVVAALSIVVPGRPG